MTIPAKHSQLKQDNVMRTVQFVRDHCKQAPEGHWEWDGDAAVTDVQAAEGLSWPCPVSTLTHFRNQYCGPLMRKKAVRTHTSLHASASLIALNINLEALYKVVMRWGGELQEVMDYLTRQDPAWRNDYDSGEDRTPTTPASR